MYNVKVICIYQVYSAETLVHVLCEMASKYYTRQLIVVYQQMIFYGKIRKPFCIIYAKNNSVCVYTSSLLHLQSCVNVKFTDLHSVDGHRNSQSIFSPRQGSRDREPPSFLNTCWLCHSNSMYGAN